MMDVFSTDDDDDDAFSTRSGESLHPRYKLHVQLLAKTNACNLSQYYCPFACSVRYPVHGFKTMTVREHVGRQHIDFVAYHCHAVSVIPRYLCNDHALHPDLLGTTMTDALLQRHKESARRMTRDIPRAPESTFSYLDITLVGSELDNRHVYACSYCSFSGRCLEDYKRHAVILHVKLVVEAPGVAGASTFPVMGSPVRRRRCIQ